MCNNMVDMENLAAIRKFVVDGEGAERIYEIFKKSYLVENNWQPYEHSSIQVDFSFADGVFRVEEKSTGDISYIEDILYFFADRDNIYSLSEYICNGATQSYDVNDAEGKYFVRPPMTEWELLMEERRNKIIEDLPF